jgi:hypothetical protein
MKTFLAILLSVIEPFRFRKHQRERQGYELQWEMRLLERNSARTLPRNGT